MSFGLRGGVGGALEFVRKSALSEKTAQSLPIGTGIALLSPNLRNLAAMLEIGSFVQRGAAGVLLE